MSAPLESWPFALVEPRRGEHETWSIAVSLKRIADALDGTSMGVDVSESLAGLTHSLIVGRIAR